MRPLSLFVFILFTAPQTLAAADTYIVSELSGKDLSQVASKLNNLGDVAGRAAAAADGETRATIWGRSHLKPKAVGVLLGGDYSAASDINDAGEVTGVSNTRSEMVPFVWTASGRFEHLQLLRGDRCGQAAAINKHGHVVGYSSGPTGSKAFLWSRKTRTRPLGILPGGSYSRARDLNDFDEVAGTSASSAGERAVLWTGTDTVRDLGTLPGDTSSEATAINNAGDVVGYSKGSRGIHAFIWTKHSGMQEIKMLPGGTLSRALDISDSGDVVGSFTTASGDRAFKWNSQSGMVDLNTGDSLNLGMIFIEAHAINSAGQILVLGETVHQAHASADSSSENYKCAPAPPSTFLLTPLPSR